LCDLNELKTEEYIGKCAVRRALLKLDVYVINNTDTVIVWPAEMDAITALLKKINFVSLYHPIPSKNMKLGYDVVYKM